MKKMWKKTMSVFCTVVMLMTLFTAYVPADELHDDVFSYEIYEENAPEVTESVPETDETAAETIEEDTTVPEESVTIVEEPVDPEIAEITEPELVGASNPYPTTQNVDGDSYYEVPCTYFAWQQVYDNTGIALPSWGNAVNWWQGAKNSGYATGSTPQPGAIAVWSGDYYGHVAYVTSGSGNTFTVNEGGRTDLDNTSSHGVKYGYTLTNAVGGRRPYDTNKILLGFIYPGSPVTGTLDVNGLLDGNECGNTDYYGSFHVYINGNRVTNNPVSDYYNASLKPGDTYEIKDIDPDDGKIYLGASSISGTIRANETSTVTLKIDSAADLGEDFYAVILNTEIWKPISLNTDTQKITLETEKAVAYQKWRFVRQGDGSYLIMSCFDGKVLEMTDGIRTNGTQLSAPGGDWGGRYQRWYLFRFGGAYMIRSAHYQDEEWVINLSNGSSADGTPINICRRNNSSAQIFSIYYDYDVQLKGVSLKATVNNNEVTFDWDRIYGAVSYDLKIWKDELWEGDAYKIVKDATSGISLSLEEGSYIAYVDSVDYFQYKMSNTVNITIKHVPKDISKCTVTLSTTSYAYNGSARKPSVTVKLGTTTLTSGTDYTVSYTNNINAGTATVTITGKNNYTGTISKTFTITKTAPTLIFASTSLSKKTGDAAFTNALTKTTDGAVTFKSSNTAVATVNSTSGKVTIKGAGTATITATAAEGTNYKSGSASYTLKVTASKSDISGCTVTLSTTSYTYNGKTKKPTVTVKNGTTALTAGTDYTASYSNNTNAGTATVTITGKGNYTGTKSVTFTIKKAAAKLTFANASVSKTTKDAAFTNTLTKTTDGTVTFKSSNTSVATVGSTSGKVTIKGAGETTITATASAGTNYKAGSASYTLTVKAPAPAGFSDVQDPTHPFYKAIYWAADAGITKGYPDGTFGIDRSCTRGEAVMFLWRMAGQPAPVESLSSPFSDVPKTHAFYKAILWASQRGITKGYSDGTFGINRTCTRGHIMTFIWRFKGEPAPKAVAKSPFSDVPKNHAYYKAILWGAQTGVTNGFSDGTFGIDKNCTRGQIVTFLYRIK